jgi:hypothetical protein
MARRRRKEVLWPVWVGLGVLGIGLGLGIVTDLMNESQGAGVSGEEALRNASLPTLDERIRVEVLNGSGIPGAAARATEVLRDYGFDVVYFGNESSFGRDSSVIVDRTGRDGALQAVSRSLGVGSMRIDPDSSLLVDVSVLLGTDWGMSAEPASETVEGAGGSETVQTDRPWWDVRRLLEGGL